jgi:hypothetical protein
MKQTFTLFTFILLSFLVHAQEPSLAWAKSIGGPGIDEGYSRAIDASGNVYITGFFNGTVDFDPGPGTFNLTAEIGYSHVFISKLDASGNFLWAKSMDGHYQGVSRSIAVDASGNVYTAGTFSGTADFDPSPGTYNLASAGLDNIFISKLDASGNFLWAKSTGIGYLNNAVNSIAVDASSNVYLIGAFTGTMDFDPGPGTFNLTSAGLGDIFVSKLDGAGNFLWAKRIGSNAEDIGNSITVVASGDIYFTGAFPGTVDFDPGPGTFNLTAIVTDIFVSKLDASGNFLWAKSMGGAGQDQGSSIAVDASGNVYTTGYFMGRGDFDPGPGIFNLTPLNNSGNQEIFISKLDASGNFLWAKNMGSIGNDVGNSIAVDASGNVYTTGYFSGTADFDPGPDTFNLTTSFSFSAIFVSKLDALGNFLWAKNMGGSIFDHGNSITVDATGNVYAAGTFSGTADFDPGPGTFNLTSNGNLDVFVVKWSQPVTCTPPTFLNNGMIVLDATCGKSDGNISIIPLSGTAPFQYSLDGGKTYVSGPDNGYTFRDLSAGTYQLRLKDAKGCESEVVQRTVNAIGCTVPPPPPPPADCTPPTFLNDGTIVANTTCGKSEGAIYLVPTSGTAPFLYSINGGASYVPSPDAVYGFTGLAAGTYSLRIKDSKGCESAIVTREVKAPDCPTTCTATTFLNNGMIVGHATCGASDGSLYLIPTSGTAPFFYSIDGGATYVSGPDGGTSIGNLAPGVYQLRIKDATGCQSDVVQKEVLALYGNCATASAKGGQLPLAAESSTAILAYPNPTKGVFRLQLSGTTGKVQVQVLNSNGAVVQQKRMNVNEGSTIDFNLSGKAKGLYFVRVVSEHGVQVAKVLVQ